MSKTRAGSSPWTATLAVLVVAIGAAGAVCAAAVGGTGNIEVRILNQGEAVPGVPVQARPIGEPGQDAWTESPEAVIDTSDARGLVRFAGLTPGIYRIVGQCGRLPGDNIAGTIATRAEVMAGATAHTTLTLRRGGRILGRAVEGELGLGNVVLTTEAVDALPSTCPILEPRNPGPNGSFTVGKVPTGTFVWIKALRPLGRGNVQVWKDFRLAEAETVTGIWNFPHLDSTQLGTVRIGVRLDEGQPAQGGRLELAHLNPEGWRYSASVEFTEAESLVVLPALPPGDYSLRAAANSTIETWWWNAAPDTLVVAPGVDRIKIIPARQRR